MQQKRWWLCLMAVTSLPSLACTTIIVGKKASQDGSILLARNVDGDAATTAAHLVYHPPRASGYLFKTVEENKFSYHLPDHLLGYTGVPDWQTKDASFEEAGFNQVGVAISATETIYSNPASLSVDPYVTDKGVVEEAIPSIILPQVHSALEGVRLLGKLIESYGSGEGFGVAFADKQEAWYLENAGGHQWLAVRIPDDSYFVSANQSRLATVNLNDQDNYLASPGLISFAEAKGLYNPARDGEFNFHKVYGQNNANDVVYNYPRMTYLQNLFTPTTKDSPVLDGDFPVFLKPQHKLSISEVEAGLSNYYQGTAHDPYTSQNPKATVRPIAVLRTQQSHVLQLRANLPPPIANVEYLSLGMTALGIYLPFYQGVKLPPSFALGSDKADDSSAFWKFRKVQTLAMQNFPKYAPWVQARYAALNQQIQAQQKQMEAQYLQLYVKNPTQAQILLQQFSDQMVAQALGAASELANRILTDQTIEIGQKYKFEGA